ncbi:MAG: hypothetical protein LBU39_08505 [Desulfobulbaceae bacterium]|jgi:hypothetical protein|nr:hypothetical protein [Desulfobulbaceae bacterium]
MSERRILKGRLFELDARIRDLETRMRMACERLGVSVNPLIHELDDMPVAEAATVMDDLVMLQAELLAARGKSAAIKRELYG